LAFWFLPRRFVSHPVIGDGLDDAHLTNAVLEVGNAGECGSAIVQNGSIRVLYEMKIGFIPALVAVALLPTHFLRADTIPVSNLVSESFGEGRQPQVTVTPMGMIVVVFARDNSIYSVQSTDEGRSFSTPQKIADLTGLMVGMRRGPRVAATDKRIVVTAPGADLFSFISEDMGKTWSPANRVNDKPGAASEGLHNVTALPDGSFYAVWLDKRNRGAQVEGSRLEPGTTSWSRNLKIYDSPDKTVCECCHPSVACDGKNKLVVMWRNWLEGNRDFYVAESMDRGDHFSPAIKMGTQSWPLKVCPMDGGGIIAVADVGNFAIWRRQNEILLSTPTSPEMKLGNGAQPVLARVNGRILSVWQNGPSLVIKEDIQKGEPQRLPGAYPSLAASPDGKRAYLVWEGTQGNRIIPKLAVLQ